MPIVERGDRFRVRREFSEMVDTREEAERLDRMAASAMRRLRRSYHTGEKPCTTILEGLDGFLRNRSVARNATPDTIRQYRRILARFANDLSRGRGDIVLEEITLACLERWIEKRLREPGKRGRTIARNTVRKEIAALHAFATWAADRRIAPRDMELFSLKFIVPKEELQAGARAALSLADFRICLARIGKASRHVALVLYGMLYFGARPQALFRLDWSDVSMPHQENIGHVILPILKKGDASRVSIPHGSPRHELLMEARALFESYYRRLPRAGDPVFCTKLGRSKRRRRGWNTDTFDHEVERLASKLSIPKTFVAYATRHSAVTWLKQSGATQTEVQRWAKHSLPDTQAVYDHTSGEDARRAYEIIERATDSVWTAFRKPKKNPETLDLPVPDETGGDLTDALSQIELAIDVT